MITAIQKETKSAEHDDYGMFSLILMSHGTGDYIYGTDNVAVYLPDLCDLLSALNFPQMSMKPKLVIVQSCRGG